MKRIGMGLVEPGFIAPHHIDAVRRLGGVVVVAIAGSHWCDLAEHVSGIKIVSVLAELTTVVPTRYASEVSAEAFSKQADGERRRLRSRLRILRPCCCGLKTGRRDAAYVRGWLQVGVCD